VRVGIGRSGESNLTDHVLSPYSARQREEMAGVYKRAADAVLCILESGVSEAMNRFNAAEAMLDNKECGGRKS